MQQHSRTKNTIYNIISGFISRFLIIILGFVVRTFFIHSLGNDYLSVNGLYTNILSMLSLAELGFGTAMVYSMYKPLADNDQKKLASLLKLYKKVYRIIGFVVLILGISVIPFMGYIIKDPPNVPHLTFYYILFLVNSVLSYWFFAYRSSVLTADQKTYICTNFHNIFNIGKSLLQIIFLLICKNFTIYLLIQLSFTVFENITTAIYATKHYPVFRIIDSPSLSKSELHTIWNNVKALMLSRLGHIILNSTDNIIISAIVGISWVGLLSNYTLITDSVTGVLCTITAAFSASLGNYFAEKNKEDSYILFERVEFLNSWLYGFSAICLIILINPFISLWLGEQYQLNELIVAAMTLNFFVQGYMNTLWTFRSTLGLFTQGWFRPIIVSFVNVVASILLGKFFGIVGILFATFLARASINLWYDPIIIHKYGFNRPAKSFFIGYAYRIIEILSIIGILEVAKHFILLNGVSIPSFIILMFVTAIISMLAIYLYSRKSDEFKYFFRLFTGLLKKLKS